MLLTALALLAAPVGGPTTPQAAAPAPNPEQQVRQALAARGMSKGGIETMIAIQRRHAAPMRAIVQRGAAAEAAVRAALAGRPIDVAAFAAAVNNRTEAVAALQREAGAMAVEQMRAATPADRVVMAQTTVPAAAPPPHR